MKVAAQLRIAIPYELSLCGFDDTPVARYMTPTLTTVSHPVEQLAQDAGGLLIRQLKKYLQPLEQEELQSNLIIRDSTGPAKDWLN